MCKACLACCYLSAGRWNLYATRTYCFWNCKLAYATTPLCLKFCSTPYDISIARFLQHPELKVVGRPWFLHRRFRLSFSFLLWLVSPITFQLSGVSQGEISVAKSSESLRDNRDVASTYIFSHVENCAVWHDRIVAHHNVCIDPAAWPLLLSKMFCAQTCARWESDNIAV